MNGIFAVSSAFEDFARFMSTRRNNNCKHAPEWSEHAEICKKASEDE